MNTGPSPALASALLFLAIIVVFLARRTYLMIRGTVYSAGRLWATVGFYALFFALLGLSTLIAGVGAWGTIAYALLAPYLAIVLLSTAISAPYVRRIVKFERRADGQLYYALPWVVPVVVLALFVARLGIQVALFGFAATSSFGPPSNLSPGFVAILIGIDLLFGVSLGLLAGRGLGVYQAYRSRAAATDPGTPLPSSGDRRA